MKRGIQVAIAAGAFAQAQSNELGSLKLPGLSPIRPKHLRALSTSGNVCSEDMNLIANNEELNDLLKKLNDEFDSDFSLNAGEYCTGTKAGDTSFLECSVDYEQFSGDYKSACVGLGGTAYNIALFMRCDGPIPGGTIDLEMQLLHIPTCVGWTCDLGEIYEVLLDAIKVAEASVSGSDSGLECVFFHDYEDLSAAPNTINFQNPIEDDAEGTTSDSIYRNSLTSVAMSVALGLFLLS